MSGSVRFVRKLVCALVFVLCASGARAEDTDLVILNWVDHLTFGAPLTVGAGLYVGGRVVGRAIRGKPVGFRVDDTGKQFVLKDAEDHGKNAWAVGPFHFEEPAKTRSTYDYRYTDGHEAAHGQQGAVLGPALLPVLGLSLLHGDHDKQPNENWASAWGQYLRTSLVKSHPVELELGWGDRRRVGARFSLLQRSSRLETAGADLSLQLLSGGTYDGYDGTPKKGAAAYPVELELSYLNLGVRAEQDCADCDGTSAILEAGLFRRDFLMDWKTILPGLRLLVDSHQEIGSFEIDIERGKTDSRLIGHKVGYGLRLGDRRYLAVDAIGRAGYGIDGKWGEENSPGLVPFVSTGYEGKVHVLDQAQIYYRADQEYGTDGYRLKRKTAGVSTPRSFDSKTFTGTDGTKGRARRFYGSVELSDESERLDGVEPTHVKMMMLNFGGRL